jgi:hypothetical protein
MSNAILTGAGLANESLLQSRARAVVTNAARAGRRVVDKITYSEADRLFALQSGHFIILIPQDFIDELRAVPSRKLKNISLSAAGTTIELEAQNIYIEAAMLIIRYIAHVMGTADGGTILDCLINTGSAD